MPQSETFKIDDPSSGFKPSESIWQTSLTKASLKGLEEAVVSLPANPLPAAAPTGYRYLDVLVIENHGLEPVRYGVLVPGEKETRKLDWTDAGIAPGQSLRFAPSPLTPDSQIIRFVAGRDGMVHIRRGRALVLAE